MTATQQQIRLAISASSSSDDRSLYRLVLDLHERIGRLEAEIRELRGQQPSEAPRTAPRASSSAQGRPKQATSSLDVASQYALSNTRTPARSVKQYDRPAFDSSPDEDTYARPSPPAQPVNASAYAIETHGRGELYNGVMRDYERALGGAVTKFEQTYQPSPAELAPNGGVRISGTPDMAPYWFVPIAHDLGLLLPSGTAMRQWSEMFQFLGGEPARQTFEIAYEVEKGDSLDVVQPAWAELSGDSVQIGRKGVLKGA